MVKCNYHISDQAPTNGQSNQQNSTYGVAITLIKFEKSVSGTISNFIATNSLSELISRSHLLTYNFIGSGLGSLACYPGVVTRNSKFSCSTISPE